MIFGREEKFWLEHDAVHTAAEINQEPEMWERTAEIVKAKKNELNTFLDQVLSEKDFDVILTGAGSSEFVGNCLCPYLNTILDHKVHSYATTDLVPAPERYLDHNRKTLLVSFGRSGNSPESVGAVETVNTFCHNIWHLFITCNPNGELNRYGQNKENCFVINTPAETHDKAFAMTSSFSSMYLACLTAFMQYKGIDYSVMVKEIIRGGRQFLDEKSIYIENIVDSFDYDRLVYLGSNCLKGISQEAALKTCELTAGEVMTIYDSSMGFRHGPKSVVKDKTLSVIFLSGDSYTRLYDMDIVREIVSDGKGKVLVVGGQKDENICVADYSISFENNLSLDSVFLGLEYLLVGQVLGLFKSIKQGNTPDNPCSTGQVSRVVKGVTIYPYNS